ncbi:MAG: histidine phosphatase family protein [Proteobacteria bacterium]|nr:histidine phosphatase family protein [Pseudomonadota bacterium]
MQKALETCSRGRWLRSICDGWLGRPQIRTTGYRGRGPSRILLMRHAEKTGNADDFYLSAEGMRRAENLVTYLPRTFGHPDFAYAAARSKRSVRSIETMKPLAAALGIEMQYHIEDKEFELLVTEIFSKSEHHGKTILVCWHHGKLPEIAARLGGQRGSFPDPWPQDVFNLILDFRYDPESDSPPIVARIIQPF